MPLLQQFDGGFNHSQGFQTQKVELHQPRRLNPFHIELGNRHIGFRVSVQRNDLIEWPITDDDTRRMGRGMAVQPFKVAGNVKHARHSRVFFCRHAQPWFALDRLLQRHRIGWILRHQFGQLINLSIRQL